MNTEDLVYVITDTEFIVANKRKNDRSGPTSVRTISDPNKKNVWLEWEGDMVRGDSFSSMAVLNSEWEKHLDDLFFELLQKLARKSGLNLDILHVINEKLTLEYKIITLIKNKVEKIKNQTLFVSIDLQIKRKVTLNDFKKVHLVMREWCDTDMNSYIDDIIEDTPHPFDLPEMKREYKKWKRYFRQELEEKYWKHQSRLNFIEHQLALLYLIQNTQ